MIAKIKNAIYYLKFWMFLVKMICLQFKSPIKMTFLCTYMFLHCTYI